MDSLRKLYYTQPAEHKRAYEQRFNAPFAKHLAISIREFNHEKEYPAFYYYPEELVVALERVSEKHRAFLSVLEVVPPMVQYQFSLSCIVDEVGSTSEIEGIHSSKKELKAVLDGEKVGSQFSSIVKKYNMLMSGEAINFESVADIRKFYDEFAYAEVLKDNPSNKLDGEIFRGDDVNVLTATGKILHRGVFPEEKIIRYLDEGLKILHDKTIPFLVRMAVFHYIFVYVHPFYDGNGRTARFISSYFIAKSIHHLPALMLSVIIKGSVKKYYELIHDTELEINCGDITPFIMGFIAIIEQAIDTASQKLTRKLHQMEKYAEKLKGIIPSDKFSQELYKVLLESSMFYGQGVTMEQLRELTGKSRNTIQSRLKKIPASHLVVRKGNKYFYKLNLLAFNHLAQEVSRL